MTVVQSDLAIIGSGSGNSLITPYWDDRRVVIAEQGTFGGTCLNVGCIPTKMYVRPASLARSAAEAERLGVSMHVDHVDWPAIRDRIFSRIDAISQAGEQYRRDLEHVELVSQRVRLTGLRSFVADDGSEVTAEQMVIAAGSRAVLPDIPGVTLPGVHTSDTVMRIDEFPRRVVVLGGGFIAAEFAGVFAGLGAEVVQVVRGERLLRHLDVDITDAFTEAIADRWDVRTQTVATEISAGGEAPLRVYLKSLAGAESIDADIVLVATGRRPNTDFVGAAEVGIDLHPDGRIQVDEFQRVLSQGEPVSGVYALGDISSPFQLKHVANHEARIVAHNLEHPDQLLPSRQTVVPAAVFSDPEIGCVGMTEAEAIAAHGADRVTVKTQRYGDTAYGWALEDQSGVCKVIADRATGQILGAQVVGYQASNLVQVIITGMSFGIDAYTLARGQYWIHPALMEVVENALLGLDVPRGMED